MAVEKGLDMGMKPAGGDALMTSLFCLKIFPHLAMVI